MLSHIHCVVCLVMLQFDMVLSAILSSGESLKMKYLTCVEDVTCANHSSERCSQPKKMLLL